MMTDQEFLRRSMELRDKRQKIAEQLSRETPIDDPLWESLVKTDREITDLHSQYNGGANE